jgi:hypothetical protein
MHVTIQQASTNDLLLYAKTPYNYDHFSSIPSNHVNAREDKCRSQNWVRFMYSLKGGTITHPEPAPDQILPN